MKMTVRAVTKETEEGKQQRLKNQRNQKQERATKTAIRQPDEKDHLIDLANNFREWGIDYLEYGKFSYEKLKDAWEGQLIEYQITTVSDNAKKFLQDNFKFTYIRDDYNKLRIYFNRNKPTEKQLEAPDNFLHMIAEKSKQPFSSVSAIYGCLVKLTKDRLLKNRKFSLPGLVRFRLSYREQEEAKPARMLVRSTPAMDLKEWGTSLEAKPPKKHSLKRGNITKKRKRKKKYKGHFDEQKEYHIT